MKLNVSEDWYRKMAEVEDDAEIGAGGILAEPSVPVAALRALLEQWRVSNILTAGDAIRYLCADQLATLCDQAEKQP